jgi:hypothetical protein
MALHIGIQISFQKLAFKMNQIFLDFNKQLYHFLVVNVCNNRYNESKYHLSGTSGQSEKLQFYAEMLHFDSGMRFYRQTFLQIRMELQGICSGLQKNRLGMLQFSSTFSKSHLVLLRIKLSACDGQSGFGHFNPHLELFRSI